MEGLYAIVDRPHPHELPLEAVTRAVLADRLGGADGHRGDGSQTVQLRAKRATTQQRIAMLEIMAPLCQHAGAALFVNDDLDAALSGVPGVVGVHLGQDDPGADDVEGIRARAAQAGLPRFQIGLSTHDLAQLHAAGRQRPDYIAFGPVAPTGSKVQPDPVVGFAGLLSACRAATRPVVAIGGLAEQGAREAVRLGAAAVATIGALVADNPAEVRRRARSLAATLREAAAPLSVAEVSERIPVVSPDILRELGRWSDSLSVQAGLGLPNRFRPPVIDGEVRYRPCDVLDLLYVLDKQPGESWAQWSARGRESTDLLVPIRTRSG